MQDFHHGELYWVDGGRYVKLHAIIGNQGRITRERIVFDSGFTVVLKFRFKLKWHQLFIKGKFVTANMHSYLNDNNTSNDDLFIYSFF